MDFYVYIYIFFMCIFMCIAIHMMLMPIMPRIPGRNGRNGRPPSRGRCAGQDLAHIVTTDLGSEQSWVLAKKPADLDKWIDARMKAPYIYTYTYTYIHIYIYACRSQPPPPPPGNGPSGRDLQPTALSPCPPLWMWVGARVGGAAIQRK